MNKKPRLLIMISTFFPAKNGGGPVISLMNLANSIKNEFDIYFISDHHDFGSNQPYTEVPNRWYEKDGYNIYYIPCNDSVKKNINNVIDEINPDVVYLNSILDYHYSIPILLNKKIRKLEIPLIISARGELCDGAFKLKRYKKLPYITVLKKMGFFNGVIWHSTSGDETEGLIKNAGIDKKNIIKTENIPSIFNISQQKKIKTKGELKLVFISRIQQKKNLSLAISILNKIEHIKIQYDIYGPMEDKEYWNECMKLIHKSPNNINIEYKGQLNHSEVASTLIKYHCFFMPTYSENYGHAIVESMLCSVPVIISDQTPWNEINEKNAGFAISLDDEREFLRTIKLIGLMNNDEYYKLVEECSKYINSVVRISEIINKNKEMFLSVMK